MQILTTKDYIYGTVDSIEDRSIPRGAASKNLNWKTQGTKIELRRGQLRLGITENQGVGRISGMGVITKKDGTDFLIRSRGRKIEYYDTVTEDWIEYGTDIIPLAADGDDVVFAPYQSLTGAWIIANSPKWNGPLKFGAYHPGSYINLAHTTNFGGFIRIKQNRMFLWNRGNTTGTFSTPDLSGIYGSYIDKDSFGDYTTITAEVVGSGTGAQTTFTGTLAFKAAGSRRNCFSVTFTDSTETFYDNGDGTLTGNLGGSGTINYISGVYSITFNTAPSVAVNNVTATYQWEDSADASAGTSKSGAIADFSKDATRLAGQGFILRQDDGGGAAQQLLSINGVEYCFHTLKTWALNLTSDDTNATNLIFRNKVGIPYFRAAIETGTGAYYLDALDQNDPHLRLLTFGYASTELLPKSVSKKLKISGTIAGISLANLRFEKAALIEFGDMVLLACRDKDTPLASGNDRVIVYDTVSGALDMMDYRVSCFAIYNGTLVAGDSISNNIYTLFSGTDDDGFEVPNYWEGKLDDLDMERLKATKKLVLEGDIGPEQAIKVSISIDNGSFAEVQSPTDVTNDTRFIEGDGSYIDRSQRVDVGSLIIGEGTLGGGGDGIEAYHYLREVKLAIDHFSEIKVRYEATKIGYASVSMQQYKDVRRKWQKLPVKYRSE